MRLIATPVLLALLASVSVPVQADRAPPKPDAQPEPKKEEITLPWTAEEVRKGWGKGVSFLLEMETEVGSGWLRWEATEISDEGFKGSELTCEKGKAPRRSGGSGKSWEKHLSGLKKELTGAEKAKGEVKVPYGTLECEIYTIKKGESTRRIALHATVPGMVVMMEMEAKRGEKRDYEKWSLKSIDLPVHDAPWTHDKIAENFKPGTKTVYAGKSSEGDAKVEYEITASDVNGMTSTSIETYEGKEPKKGEPATVTWDGYLRFFMPPRFDTATSEEKLKTPAGEFVCVVHAHKTESEGVKLSQKVWLAKDEPGLLVRCDIEQEMGGKKIFYNMELTEFSKGK